MDVVSEIKSRISIEELVGQYVQLKKSGRNFKALCPFHAEKTPSFHVSVEKQLAYCFGCRKGGDHFKFIEEIEGVDFKGALSILADKAGVEIPKSFFAKDSSGKSSGERKTERERLEAAHEAASLFFENNLWETDDGKRVLKYLKKRNLSEETIKAFRIGFAPPAENSLFSHLLGLDFTRGEIFASGLAVARSTDDDSKVYDKFRMRLMFPIENIAGKICAFGGRAVKDGEEPKYLNSPETILYHKSSVLYALSRARQSIREQDKVIIVEGYMDAVSVHQAGIKNVVACSGTALTSEQMAVLKRFTKNVIFSFDRDEAGIKATERAIELGYEQDLNICVSVWKSKAKDPDECIREDRKIYEQAINSAAPASQYLLDSTVEKFDLKSTSGKRQAIENLLSFWARVKSPVELDQSLRNASNVLDVSAQSLYDELKRYQGKQRTMNLSSSKVQNQKDENLPESNKESVAHEYLLGLLLTYKEVIPVANQMVSPEDFEDVELQNIYRTITTQYNQQGADFEFSDSEKRRADVLSMFIEARHGDTPWDSIKEEVQETVKSIVKKRFDHQKKGLVGQIKRTEGKKKMELLDLYQDLITKEQSLISHTDTLWQKN